MWQVKKKKKVFVVFRWIELSSEQLSNSRSLLLCEMSSWSFFKCDRCEHPAEQSCLLQWQVTEMFKRASNCAVRGWGGDDSWKRGAFKSPRAMSEKCKDLSVHIYAVAQHSEVTLRQLLLPSRPKETRIPFNVRKYLLKIRTDTFHQPRIPKLLSEVVKLFLLTESLRSLVTSSAPLVRPGTRKDSPSRLIVATC